MNTCALSGQAAGTLAARCIELGKRPGDLEAEEIQGVQQTLLRNDMMIPGIRHREERDLAREAGVSSSGAECRGALLELSLIHISRELMSCVSSNRGAGLFSYNGLPAGRNRPPSHETYRARTMEEASSGSTCLLYTSCPERSARFCTGCAHGHPIPSAM